MKRARLCKNAECNERFTPANVNHKYHEDSCRRKATVWRKESDLLADELGVVIADESMLVKEALSQRTSDIKEIEKLKSLRELIKYEINSARLAQVVPHFTFPKKKEGNLIAVPILSDWQIGKMQNGIGTKETSERIARYANETLSISEFYGVDYVVPIVAGDMNEGCFIYRGQNVTGLDRRDNTHRLIVQIKRTADEQAYFMKLLASTGLQVFPIDVPGNHGRPNGYNDFADKEDNFDTMSAWWADDINTRDDGIMWDIYEDWKAEVSIGGVSVLAMHGDQWTGPLDKLDTLLPQWIATDFVKKPDIVVVGHRHQFEVRSIGNITVIQNGTLDGGSNWYAKAYGRTSRPTQVVLILREGVGIEAIHPVYF